MQKQTLIALTPPLSEAQCGVLLDAFRAKESETIARLAGKIGTDPAAAAQLDELFRYAEKYLRSSEESVTHASEEAASEQSLDLS